MEGELSSRAAAVEWLLLDVDGVLTDGRLYYGRGGERLQVFHVRDGLAIRLAQRAGIRVGIVSGRRGAGIAARATELGVDRLFLGVRDKAAAFDAFVDEVGTDPRQVACVGDDLPDLALFQRCGVSLAPADAADEVRRRADRVLAAGGGRGAVREAVELLLAARGAWEAAVAAFATTAPADDLP